MNDEIEGTTITGSNRGEVTHVACRQSTDAQRLAQRHHRSVDKAQAPRSAKPRSTSMAHESWPIVDWCALQDSNLRPPGS